MLLKDRVLYLKIIEVSFINYLDLKVTRETTIKDRHIDFTGSRNKEGCQGSITIYNPGYGFDTEKDLAVELWGGYDGSDFKIFRGDVTNIETGKEGIDERIIFSANDGLKLNQAEKFVSYASGTQIKSVVSDMIADLKKAGAEMVENILDKIRQILGAEKITKSKSRDKLISNINKVLEGYKEGSSTVIHNNIIDILIDGQIGGTIIDLNPESGLIGDIQNSIKIEKGKKPIATTKATSLMMHDFKIGQIVKIKGSQKKINSINYNISNYNLPFYADMELE